MPESYKYYAFISYSRKDSRVAAWLQRRLEWFRFPVKLVPEDRRPPNPRYVRPIYRDKTNLEVTDEHYWTNIRRALEESRYLIVLCSPQSASSEPVNMEVEHFLATHGSDASLIAPVIVSGNLTNAGDDTALCPALRTLGDTLITRNLPTMVTDAVTAERDAWEQGFVSLVSYLLHLERTSVGDHIQRETSRQARVLRRWLVAVGTSTLIAVACALFAFRSLRQAEASEESERTAKDNAINAQDKAIAARKAADELIRFMQYDLSDTLGKLGSLNMMDGINARIRRYHEEHPPDIGDEAATNDAALEESVALEQRGELQMARGELAAALRCFRDSLAVRQTLVEKTPNNRKWQRALAFAYSKMGDAHQAQGDLGEALRYFRDSLAVRRALVEKDPDNEDALRDVSVSLNRIGDVQRAQRDLPAALVSFREGLAIRQKLVSKHPDRSKLQRDLAINLERAGEVQQAQGDFAAALKSYQDSLAVFQTLSQKDPDNADWQRDLSVTFKKVGEVQLAQGNLAAAQPNFRESLTIAHKLFQKDPDNALWQSDLTMSLERVGQVAQRQQRWSDAVEVFSLEVEIARPWLDEEVVDVKWIGVFAYGAGRCWEVLRDAPSGTVKLDRAALLADLRIAKDRLKRLQDQNRLAPPMDTNLRWIDSLLAKAETPGK